MNNYSTASTRLAECYCIWIVICKRIIKPQARIYFYVLLHQPLLITTVNLETITYRGQKGVPLYGERQKRFINLKINLSYISENSIKQRFFVRIKSNKSMFYIQL